MKRHCALDGGFFLVAHRVAPNCGEHLGVVGNAKELDATGAT
jgi:hypothetical protein